MRQLIRADLSKKPLATQVSAQAAWKAFQKKIAEPTDAFAPKFESADGEIISFPPKLIFILAMLAAQGVMPDGHNAYSSTKAYDPKTNRPIDPASKAEKNRRVLSIFTELEATYRRQQGTFFCNAGLANNILASFVGTYPGFIIIYDKDNHIAQKMQELLTIELQQALAHEDAQKQSNQTISSANPIEDKKPTVIEAMVAWFLDGDAEEGGDADSLLTSEVKARVRDKLTAYCVEQFSDLSGTDKDFELTTLPIINVVMESTDQLTEPPLPQSLATKLIREFTNLRNFLFDKKTKQAVEQKIVTWLNSNWHPKASEPDLLILSNYLKIVKSLMAIRKFGSLLTLEYPKDCLPYQLDAVKVICDEWISTLVGFDFETSDPSALTMTEHNQKKLTDFYVHAEEYAKIKQHSQIINFFPLYFTPGVKQEDKAKQKK